MSVYGGILLFPSKDVRAQAITTTTTITHRYDFPDSEPTITTSDIIMNTCPAVYYGEEESSWIDTDGDGVTDTQWSGGAGQTDKFGGRTQSGKGYSSQDGSWVYGDGAGAGSPWSGNVWLP